MRTTCSTDVTKILPSPILPVLAALTMASMQRSTSSFLTTTSTFTLGRKSTTYSAPRYSSVCPFWRPNPLTSVTVRPVTPQSASASRTSSSLNGLTTAVICFMAVPFLFLSAEFTGNRIAPILAKAAMGDPNPHGSLPALVFVDTDQPGHPLYHGAVKARRDDLLHALVVLHVALQDRIQHFVGRQAVLVDLAGPQFRAGRARDDALGNGADPGAIRVVDVAPACKPEDRGLE